MHSQAARAWRGPGPGREIGRHKANQGQGMWQRTRSPEAPRTTVLNKSCGEPGKSQGLEVNVAEQPHVIDHLGSAKRTKAKRSGS